MSNDNLLSQARQTFQRGDKRSAQKILAQLIMREPRNASAWMLMARVVAEKERKIDCYEHLIKLNPDNVEAKTELVRLQFPGYTFDIQRGIVPQNSSRLSKRFKFLMGTSFAIMAILLVLASTTYAIAKNNPQSPVAKFFISSTPTPDGQYPGAGDVASKTRTEVREKYPQYAPLVDALIGFAVDSAENGMDGAPARPGNQMAVSDQTGKQARSAVENALPRPGSSSSVRLTQQQVTSWMALELKNSPDLPAHNVQVYFKNGQVQVWGIVEGRTNSTSALAIGTVELDSNGIVSVNIESAQIGQKQVPSVFLLQAEGWLNQLIVEETSKQAPGLRITRLDIGNGVIAISGTR
jgi:hypothetical protein